MVHPSLTITEVTDSTSNQVMRVKINHGLENIKADYSFYLKMEYGGHGVYWANHGIGTDPELFTLKLACGIEGNTVT